MVQEIDETVDSVCGFSIGIIDGSEGVLGSKNIDAGVDKVKCVLVSTGGNGLGHVPRQGNAPADCGRESGYFLP